MEKKTAAFSGTWYPSGATECETMIQQFLAEKKGPATGTFAGGIVPHAGWRYSGSIACRVIASLRSETRVDTVILFGAHMHRQSEPFIMTHGYCETPFGDIEIDDELVSRITSGISIRKRSPLKFPEENTLELQYPFIKYFFPEAKMVTCGVAPSLFAPVIGSLSIREARLLGRHVKVIGSTDMTHYGRDFGFMPAGTGKKAVDWVRNENDRKAMDAMIAMDEEAIIRQGQEHHNMCCPGAAAAAAAACRVQGAKTGMELDYATSYDLSGSADSFVGYAGILYPVS